MNPEDIARVYLISRIQAYEASWVAYHEACKNEAVSEKEIEARYQEHRKNKAELVEALRPNPSVFYNGTGYVLILPDIIMTFYKMINLDF
jgi:hypothetical protein